MRTKEAILEEFMNIPTHENDREVDRFMLEILCDIRDELYSANNPSIKVQQAVEYRKNYFKKNE